MAIFLFLKTPSPSKKTENEEISTNRKRRCPSVMQQKSESPTSFLEVLPPTRPATQNVWYLVMIFASAKRISGWPRGRNFGGVTGELRRRV